MEEKYVVGVCAMELKSRSKPMRNILSGLTNDFRVEIFSEKMIMDENVTEWPLCNFLISFYSMGFPLDKAISYSELRKPYVVNDLSFQKLLFDRRLVYSVLDSIGVPTLQRVVINRVKTVFSPDVVKLARRFCNLDKLTNLNSFKMISKDVLWVDGVEIEKPFVEKPIDAEDHNVYVYFHSSQGGGCRRLFRKIANKSSSFDEEWEIRNSGSFIYEKYVDFAEDVKVYTIGQENAHAETRKSPVIDGIVQRNHEGKEIRFTTTLSLAEQEYSQLISTAFRQAICGFDLIRTQGQSYVIDVNGWSFVKGNQNYYDQCSLTLTKMFHETASKQNKKQLKQEQNQWKLKGFFCVLRHADRTPKLKQKFIVSGALFQELLNKKIDCNQVLFAAKQSEQNAQVSNLISLLQVKNLSNTQRKIQLKPYKGKILVIVKWGGLFTHAGAHQAVDLAQNLKTDLSLLDPNLLLNVSILSAKEERVLQTANVFLNAFDCSSLIEISPCLDDAIAAKDIMDQIKTNMKHNIDLHEEIEELLTQLEKSNLNQNEWCCGETKESFKERWRGMLQSFYKQNELDLTKIPEANDSLKYDLLHNRAYLNQIFEKSILDSFYEKTKTLFRQVGPAEFGTNEKEKRELGMATSGKLLSLIINDLENATLETKFYFTKERHIQTLLNLVFLMETKVTRESLGEMDYLSQICFELYEKEKKSFVRVSVSPGAQCDQLYSIEVPNHCLSTLPRKTITNYIALEELKKVYFPVLV